MKSFINKLKKAGFLRKKTVIISAAVFVALAISLGVFASTQITEKVSFWSNIESTFDPGVLESPQKYANEIDVTPKRMEITDTQLTLPTMPEGFAVKISGCSNPDVISSDGKITVSEKFTYVSFRYEVTRLKGERKAYSQIARVLVPGKPPADNSSNLVSQGITYIQQRKGIFLHLVSGDNAGLSGSGLVLANGESVPGIAEYCNQFNIDKVVQDISDLGFNIVYVTDFHGLGVTLHPSATIDYWRGLDPKTGKTMFASERDLLGEFISKLKAKGIYTVIFTHPLDGHDFTSAQQKLLGWGSGDMDADYNNNPNKPRTPEQTAIINVLKASNFKKWNDFINDVYADIMSRYGKDILGIGFDSAWGDQQQENIDGVKKLDIARLKATLQSYNKDIELASLGGGTPMPTTYVKEVWRPSWMNLAFDNFNVETWPSYNRPPAVVMTQHWTTTAKQSDKNMHLTGSQIFRYSVMQYTTSTTGPAVLWSTTPYTNGQWQADVYEQLMIAKQLADPIKEALDNTLPSTSYPISSTVTLSSLPNGISATKSKDGRVEYIHVLNAPSSSTLSLPKPSDSKQFSSAVLLKTGQAVTLVQNSSGVTLTLPAGSSWDKLDTVIKLTVNS